MSELATTVNTIDLLVERDKNEIIDDLIRLSEAAGYTAVDVERDKPWGGYIRFSGNDADDFVRQFFPGVSVETLKLGREELELSPKFLIVSPGERLSWQRHERRAERWVFLTPGGYHKSSNPDEQGELIAVEAGESVQFETGECHRLVGGKNVTLVAEIWQHTDTEWPSDEDDIERLADDYQR